jgi:hypothetical protein
MKLFYHISNCGDGSVSLNLHQTEQEANTAEEDMDEGWGEPSTGEIEFKIENGKLFYQDFQEIDGKYGHVWIEIND